MTSPTGEWTDEVAGVDREFLGSRTSEVSQQPADCSVG